MKQCTLENKHRTVIPIIYDLTFYMLTLSFIYLQYSYKLL